VTGFRKFIAHFDEDDLRFCWKGVAAPPWNYFLTATAVRNCFDGDDSYAERQMNTTDAQNSGSVS